MLLRKYNEGTPPEGLGELAADLEEKGYMTLIVVHPGENFDYFTADCAFDTYPCIGGEETLEDIENDVLHSLYQLNNARTKILPP
jgi:hypothetical protein